MPPDPPKITVWDKAGVKLAVDYVANEWIARVEDWMDPQVSLEWLEKTMVERMRAGSLTNLTKIIEAAEAGDYIADRGLTLGFHSMLDVGEVPPASVRNYMARRDLRPAPRRAAGSHTPHEDLRRNYALAVMVALACEVWNLLPTRNRATRRARRPCGASLVAAAATRCGYDVSESRVANMFPVYGPMAVQTIRAHVRQKLGLPEA